MAFIDDGKYRWQDVYLELVAYIQERTFKSDNHKEIYDDLKLVKEFIYDIIHI